MKLAVIGTGWIVKSFIDGLKFAPDFELFAVYSRSRERGEKFAKENGISKVYTSLDELAASPAECVYIASPNALHYTQSKKNARERKACHLRKADNRNARRIFGALRNRGRK